MANWWDGILQEADGGTATVGGQSKGNWWDGILTEAPTEPKEPEYNSPEWLNQPSPLRSDIQKRFKELPFGKGLTQEGIDERISLQRQLDQLDAEAKALGREPTRRDVRIMQSRDPYSFSSFVGLPYRAVAGIVPGIKNKLEGVLDTGVVAGATAVGATDTANDFRAARDRLHRAVQFGADVEARADKDAIIGETLASWTRQAANSLGEAVVVGSTGGLGGLAAFYGAGATSDSLAEGEGVGTALSHGLIEGAFTMLGGKLLGAGTGKLASKLGGKAISESSAAAAAKIVAKRFPIVGTLREAAKAGVGEVGEEVLTEIAHYMTDVASGKEKEFSWGAMLARAKAVIGPSLLAGGAAHFGMGSDHVDPAKVKAAEKVATDAVNKLRKRNSKLESTAAVVQDAEDFRAENPDAKVEPTRTKFEEATKKKGTTKEYRDNFVVALDEFPALAAARAKQEAEAARVTEVGKAANPGLAGMGEEFPALAAAQARREAQAADGQAPIEPEAAPPAAAPVAESVVAPPPAAPAAAKPDPNAFLNKPDLPPPPKAATVSTGKTSVDPSRVQELMDGGASKQEAINQAAKETGKTTVPQTGRERVNATLAARGYNVADPNFAETLDQLFSGGELSKADEKQLLAMFPPIEAKHRPKAVPPVPVEQREAPAAVVEPEPAAKSDSEKLEAAMEEVDAENEGDVSFDTEAFDQQAKAEEAKAAKLAAREAQKQRGVERRRIAGLKNQLRAEVDKKDGPKHERLVETMQERETIVRGQRAKKGKKGKPGRERVGRVVKLRKPVITNAKFVENLKELIRTDPDGAKAVIDEGTHRSKLENERRAVARNQYRTIFGEGDRAADQRKRSRKAEGDDHIKAGLEDTAADIQGNIEGSIGYLGYQETYPELLSYASKLYPGGDVGQQLHAISAEGISYLDPIPRWHFIDELMGEWEAADQQAQSEGFTLDSSPAPPAPKPIGENVPTTQPNLINDLHRGSLPGQTDFIDDNGDFYVDKELPAGPGVQVDEAGIRKIFPGSKTERISDSTIRVTLRNGASADIVSVQNMKLTPEAKAKMRARYPKVSDAEWDKAEARGYHVVVAKDGEQLPIHSLIALSERQGAGEETLRHEGVHWARKLGLFTDAEWSSLADKYANGIEGDANIEEAIAEALGKGQATSLAQKIRDFFRSIAKALGFPHTRREVSRLLSDPEFWARSRGGQQQAGGFQLDPEITRKLANFAKDQRARVILADLDRAATLAGEPGVVHDADVEAEAAQRLATNRAGEREAIMKAGQTGGQLNDVQTIISHQLWEDEAEAYADPAARQQISDLRDAARATGTTQARAFRQRRDPLNGKSIYQATPKERRNLIVAELFDRTDRQQQKYQKALDSGDQTKIKQLRAEHAAYLKQIEKFLNGIGTSLDEIEQISKDPIATMRLRNQVSAGKANWVDKLYEFWNNSILSGITTSVANFSGNAASGLFEFGAQRPLAAVSGELMRGLGFKDVESAYIGELPHIWRGMGQGISEGMRNALLAWNTEAPVTRSEGKYDRPRTAIPDKYGGRIIRMPWRSLTAADEFFNSMFSAMQVGAEAYRTGKLLNYSGDDLSAHIERELADRESLSWRLAKVHAAELTFQQKPEGFAAKAKQAGLAARALPSGRWFLPFITFPINNATIALRKAPVAGDIAFAKKVYNNWRDGNPIMQGVNRRLAERAVAWAVTVALASTIDRDDPWITGSSRTTPKGWPTNSIRIGGQWFSYGRIEPFATALSITIDGINAVKSGSVSRMASAPQDVIASQIADKTFLKGVSDLMILAGVGGSDQSRAPGIDRAATWAAEFGQSFVPNFFQQTAAAFRENKDQFRVWGKGEDKFKRIGTRMAQGAEVLPVERTIAYDAWGRPIVKGGSPLGPAPATDFIWRLLSPVQSTAMQPTMGDRILAAYNNAHPDDQTRIDVPARYFKVRGVSYAMSDKQYEELQRNAGQLANRLVVQLVQEGRINASNPTKRDIEIIRKLRARARNATMKELRADWVPPPEDSEE